MKLTTPDPYLSCTRILVDESILLVLHTRRRRDRSALCALADCTCLPCASLIEQTHSRDLRLQRTRLSKFACEHFFSYLLIFGSLFHMAQVQDSSKGVTLETVFMKPPEGLPSIIQKHCLRALKEKHEECLWLCMKRRGRMVAKDIPVSAKDPNQITLFDLRKQCSWWKRYSLYSAKGVKEVMV